MEDPSSSSSKLSLPSRYGVLLTLGYYFVYCLTFASSYIPRLPHSARMSTRMTTRGSSRTEPSPLVLDALPVKPRKFKRLRKRLFSRTRRGYRNNGLIGTIEEVERGAPTGQTRAEELDETTRRRLGKRIRAIREANQKARNASLLKRRKKSKPSVEVKTVEELRYAVLDRKLSLSDTTIVEPEPESDTPESSAENASPLMDHAVRNLIKDRYLCKSTPGNRIAGDNSTLALAIEGGGMRGCVSAGMMAAITALGLSDSIDTIYGSSAGSVVGAYMVSRQVCMDVYIDILPASKKLFVCKKRLVANLASLGLGQMLSGKTSNGDSSNPSVQESPIRPPLSSLKERLYNTQPGMNISFVLDGILDENSGLRPLDLDNFKANNKHQKLRVVSSCVDPHTGKLFSKCFGDEDFFHEDNAMVRADQAREGLFACLQASMTVPGATGPPVNLLPKSNMKSNNADQTPFPCFDAFCFEPIPYRSAVEEGATHVVVLASRPEDFIPKTKPGIYETGIAPLYFNSHGQPKVSEFFEKGGQQYLYAEDLMLLQQAKKPTKEGVLVPPPEILYGVERTKEVSSSIQNRRDSWKRAHLFPLRVPKGYKELQTLDQDKDSVLEAVRDGFMTAFDALSDIVGLEGYKGKDVAELIFPSSVNDGYRADAQSSLKSPLKSKLKPLSSMKKSASSPSLTLREKEILRNQLRVPGEPIPNNEVSSANDDYSNDTTPKRRRKFYRRIIHRRGGGLFGRGFRRNRDAPHQEDKPELQRGIRLDEEEFSASALLESLPGFQDGHYSHLAKGLIEQQQQQRRHPYRSQYVQRHYS